MRIQVIQFSSFVRMLAVGLCIVCCSVDCFADADVVVQQAANRAAKVTVRLKAKGQLSSGIVIAASGKILTVNHGLPSAVTSVRVMDCDGKVYESKVVERNVSLDLAVLQITGEERPKHVAVIASTAAVPEQSVLATGYPARSSTAVAALVRLGTIERLNADLIRSTCQLTVGDSGGGVFDLDGRLIGLNQRIGAGRSANIHATIKRCFEAIPAVKSSAVLDSKASSFNRIDGHGHPFFDSNHSPVLAARIRTLTVLKPLPNPSENDDAEVLCRATLWSSKIAITKLSELQQRSEVRLRTHQLNTVVAKVIKADRSNDLAVLELQESIIIPDVLGPADCRLYQLVVVGDRAVDVAILGRVGVNSLTAKTMLGCGLEIVDGQIQVDRISANSAAAQAKILVGDVITRIDGFLINNFEEFAMRLQFLQPGDWAIFEVVRDGVAVKCQVQMQQDPAAKLDRTTFLDGAIRAVSLRRTGFVNAIQHDGDLRPSDMGSPLLSLRGELLGINIAVRSRETTIAIPVKTVQVLIDQLSAK